jgi:hypothetical protein
MYHIDWVDLLGRNPLDSDGHDMYTFLVYFYINDNITICCIYDFVNYYKIY